MTCNSYPVTITVVNYSKISEGLINIPSPRLQNPLGFTTVTILHSPRFTRVSVSHTVSFFSTNLLFPIGFSYTFIASFYLLTSAALLSQSNQLIVPLVKLSTYGPRSFAVAGPTIWNNLPEYPELSIDNFRRQLKTFLFAQYCRRHCSALETSCLCTL